jgi:hypothetical protein
MGFFYQTKDDKSTGQLIKLDLATNKGRQFSIITRLEF